MSKQQGCREKLAGGCGCIWLLFAISFGLLWWQGEMDWVQKTLGTSALFLVFMLIGTIAGTSNKLPAKQPAGPGFWGSTSPYHGLRSTDFELFLADVFKKLGYVVVHTGQSGDQGADLIIEKGGTRIAVQAKGYSGPVGNDAVQQAFAGMHFHACQRFIVVTNSTFTASALALAATMPFCMLIDGNQLQQLIDGKLGL